MCSVCHVGGATEVQRAGAVQRGPCMLTTPERNPPDAKYVKAIVNKQYNTPIGLYSNANVDQTFTGQSDELLQMIG